MLVQYYKLLELHMKLESDGNLALEPYVCSQMFFF